MCNTQKFTHVFLHCHHQPQFLISSGELVIGKQAMDNSGGAELTEILTQLQNRVCVHMC